MLKKGTTMSFNQAKDKNFALFYLKLGLLLFWACWFSLAFTTNTFDFIHTLGGLPETWAFRSKNYDVLQNVLAIYQTPIFLLNALFTCDIFIQGLSALLFWLAFFSFWRRRDGAWRYINSAFTLSIALWAVFVIMEEIFIAYQFENVHLRLLLVELVSLFAIHFL